MDISVIVPLYNEAESLPELSAWITRVMDSNCFTYEVIFIDDGSTDDSWRVIESLKAENPCLKGVKFRRNYGKSPALHTGLPGRKAMWSLRWMPICKTVPMKFRNFTE